MNIKELEQERDKHTTGFFWLGLHIAIIFAVPAIAAVLIGKFLNHKYDASNWTTVLLALTFIGSWVVVGFMYKKKSKILNEIESQIRDLRISEENQNNKSENK